MIKVLLMLSLLLSFTSCKTQGRDKGGESEQYLNNKTVKKEESTVKFKNINRTKISIPEENNDYAFNSNIEIKWIRHEELPIDSILVFFNNNYITSVSGEKHHFSYKIPEGKVGKLTIKIEVYHNEKERSIAFRNIIVKPDKAPKKYNYKIIKVHTHDPNAYTQGLVFHDGYMYEGTGGYGKSSLRKIDISTGKALSSLSIDSKYFGEGITIYKDKIYQLTWTSRKGFIYDLNSFSLESTFNYTTQGWGITTIDNHLIMSDGSNKLYRLIPENFSQINVIEVYDHNGPITKLNELEYINGLVWANVWMTDRIVMIDPQTGRVKGELNMDGLLTENEWRKLDKNDDVLNGIAWNPENKTVYLTGKNWPKLFELKVYE